MPSTKHEPKSSWSEGEASSGEGVGDKRPAGNKLKRNCAKWWWLYLLVLIIVVIAVVIPIIFVGVRKVAQSEIDKATVSVNYQAVTNPGPTMFDLQLNTTVESHSSHKATVKGFNASFFLLNTEPNIKPFIYAAFPQVQSNGVNLVNFTDSKVRVADMEQFIAYNKLVLNSETFSIGVRGNTQVVLSGLPHYSVAYNKVVTMKGFNKFAGFSIVPRSVQFYFAPLFDGATMTGRVSIPNPSVISAQFGNITMQLSANGTYLGYSIVEYVQLNPGNNTFNMRSYLNTTLALNYIHDNVLDLQIVGNSSVNIGGQHLTYYEEALKSNTINYRLNLTEALAST